MRYLKASLPYFCLFFLTLLFLQGFRVLNTASQTWAVEIKSLPSPTLNQYPSLTTQIFDRDNNLIYEIHGNVNRKITQLSNLPDYVKNAFLAVEDQTFEQHKGFSSKAILRAAAVDIKNRRLLEGASTISQQLVRALWLSPQKTWQRKIKELVLAVWVETKYSKEEILENFLNNIPMGFNLVGIETGARTYFGKSAQNLTLTETALLTALSNSPTLLNPYTNRNKLNQRARIVLTEMRSAGLMSAHELLQAKQREVEKVTFNHYTPLLEHPYFSMFIRAWLEEKYGADLVENGGLKVYTTLNPDLQRLAEKLVSKYAKINGQRFYARDLGVLALDPKTGEVLAWVGGVDFARSQVDMVTALRQPGSAIKPLVYLVAFEKGFTPETLVLDQYEEFGQGYMPTDYGGNVSGEWRTVRTALAASLNIPAVRVLRKIGIADTIRKLEQLGLPLTPARYYGLSLGLGAVEISPLDLAQGFQVLADNGKKITISPITKIVNGSGKILYFRSSRLKNHTTTLQSAAGGGGLSDEVTDGQFYRIDRKISKKIGAGCGVAVYKKLITEEIECVSLQVANQRAVAMVNSILSDYKVKHAVYGYGTQFKNYTLSNRPAAAKTGTSSGPKDTWTVGFTPNLLTVVWAGNLNGSDLVSFADGINVAAPPWHEFMTKALEGASVEKFADYKKAKPAKGFEYIQ